ncbi:uncharacterized protein [Medicago truncatula]|uniref:uncharacterized protein n=1 Tax=Medicago truncatula TaxID=3880 RepID=UPI000D2F1BD8|nr:uncharacterized protein LOC112420284 [Medicago truncatula]
MPHDDDLNRAAWERCNHLVQSWLINSVSDSIAQTIVFCDTALEVWLDLKERFFKIDRIRIANMRSSINNLKQGAKSVLDYFTEMKSLWEKLSSHRPIPNCSCIHPCRCVASRVAKTLMNEDQIVQFLTGLNDQFLVHGYPNVNKPSPHANTACQEDSENGAMSSSGSGASASSPSAGFSQ